MKWIYKFARFMNGRYGIDELYKFLFKIYIILLIVDIFTKNNIIIYLELIVFVFMFYRFFSKNNTSKDHFYSICKECRNKKKE